MALSCYVATISRLLYRAAPTSMLMPTANNNIRSLKYLHAEKMTRKSAKHLVERKIMRIFAAEYHKYITNMRTVRQNSINNVTFHSQVNKDAPNVTTLQAMSECESGKELEELTIDNINNLEEYISKL